MIRSEHSAEPGFNVGIALEVTGGDTELLKELADLFLQEYPNLLANLQAAVKERNSQRIESTAHKLKGSTSTFGARAAVEASLALERKGRYGDLEGVDLALAHLEHTYEPLLLELRDYQPDSRRVTPGGPASPSS